MSIEKAYNHWAALYDAGENKTRDLDKEATIQTLDKLRFSKVIELGCGTGKNTAYLLKRGHHIIGLDFSEEMLNKARQKIRAENVVLLKTDLRSDWHIPNDYADLVTCSLVLEHIKDMGPIFRQANEKLKKHGLFFISELHPFRQYLGSKAKYENEEGIQELETFTHHISEYLDVANEYGFELMELKEWFDQQHKDGIPRLISFIWRKQA